MGLIDKLKRFFQNGRPSDAAESANSDAQSSEQSAPDVDKPVDAGAKTDAAVDEDSNKDKHWWMVRELEFRSQTDFKLLRTDNSACFSLGYLLFCLPRVSLADIVSATVVSSMEDYLPRVVSARDIWDMDVFSAVDYSGDNKLLIEHADEREVSVTVVCRPSLPDDKEFPSSYMVNVHLRSELDKAGSTYVRVSITCPPVFRDITPEKLPLKTKRWDLLLAYDKQDPKQKMQEYDYIKSDLMQKLKDGRRDELNQMQFDMLFEMEYLPSFHFFVAMDLVKREHYALAISMLIDVYEYLRGKWIMGKTSKGEDKIMFECLFNLGLCHNKLQMYREAMAYMDMVSPNNPYVGHIPFMKVYLQCLIDSMDIRTAYVINLEIQMLQNKEKKTQEDEKYRIHLLSVHAHYLLRNKLYMKAKELYKELLNVPDKADEALDALAFIQKQEAQNSEKKV